MKLRNYVTLMVVGIVVMALMPLAPCGAGWSHEGSNMSGGSPPSGSDQERGDNYWWHWSYDVTGIDRGGNFSGSWAEANFEADADAYVYSWSWEATSESTSPSNLPQPSVWGDSEYLNRYPQNPLPATYDYYANASGTVTVYGDVDDTNIAIGDTLDSSGVAFAEADADMAGWGWASGSVSENSIGSAAADVGGIATRNSPPTITQLAGYYYAELDFTVYVSSSGTEYNYLIAPSYLGVYVDAFASISSSLGYSGNAYAWAEVDFGGETKVDVTLP